MNLCSDRVGAVTIAVRSLPRGVLRSHYLTVRHDGMPDVTQIKYLGIRQDKALEAFGDCRQAAFAILTEPDCNGNWWSGS